MFQINTCFFFVCIFVIFTLSVAYLKYVLYKKVVFPDPRGPKISIGTVFWFSIVLIMDIRFITILYTKKREKGVGGHSCTNNIFIEFCTPFQFFFNNR